MHERENEKEVLKQSLIQIATLVQRLEARSEQAVRQVESGVSVLEQAAQRLNGEGGQFTREALQALRSQAQQTLSQGATQAVDEFQKKMQTCTKDAQWAAQAMSEQRKLMTTAQKTLVWKGAIALMLGSLLALLGSGLYVNYSLREVKEAQFAKSVLRATRTGVLTPCGEGALCIKVGPKAQRMGKEGEYVVLVE